jgi:hypothetical protein
VVSKCRIFCIFGGVSKSRVIFKKPTGAKKAKSHLKIESTGKCEWDSLSPATHLAFRLNDIFQCPTLNPLGMPPSTTKIQHHITKLANNKSPGESGIPAEALKALPRDGIEYVRTLLQDFWEGRRIYEEWQTILLRASSL